MICPYIGSKEKHSDFITTKLPKNIKTYIEPFGGMFSIYFSMNLEEYKQLDEVIYNDINPLNHNLFKSLKNPINFELERGEDKFYEYQKEIFNSNIDSPNYELAYKYAYVLCSSRFLSDIENSEFSSDVRYDRFLKLVSEYKKRIKRIRVKKQDYKKVIKNNNHKKTFLYLDPPYYTKEKYYKNHNFNNESHFELKEVLKKFRGKFMLSCQPSQVMEELYPRDEFNWYEKYVGAMGKEILITNYELS